MTGDRAALLAAMADEFMASGGTQPWVTLPAGCTEFRVSFWPEAPAGQPYQVHFAASWGTDTLVCTRALNPYLFEGDLHRGGVAP